jgi:hypothetical protein
MLVTAFIVLGLTILFGTVLAVLHLRSNGAGSAPRLLAAFHGLLGIFGLCCLAVALRGAPRGVDQGMGAFGMIAATLVTLGALVGVGFLAARILKKRVAGALIGIHATLAVSGFVILAAYVFAG